MTAMDRTQTPGIKMKTKIDFTGAGISQTIASGIRIAPSLRVPVTAANRSLLRCLRAAEQAAWEAGPVSGHRHVFSRGRPPRCSQKQSVTTTSS